MITTRSGGTGRGAITFWKRWPGRIAEARPPCSTPGCRAPAMRWCRCACGAPFATCGDCDRDPIALRAAHRAAGCA